MKKEALLNGIGENPESTFSTHKAKPFRKTAQPEETFLAGGLLVARTDQIFASGHILDSGFTRLWAMGWKGRYEPNASCFEHKFYSRREPIR
jgi:hypothetical protein